MQSSKTIVAINSGPERPDLRVRRPRRRRGPAHDRAEADRARPRARPDDADEAGRLPAAVLRRPTRSPPSDLPRSESRSASSSWGPGRQDSPARFASASCWRSRPRRRSGSATSRSRWSRGQGACSHLLRRRRQPARAAAALQGRLTMDDVPSYGEVHGEASICSRRGPRSRSRRRRRCATTETGSSRSRPRAASSPSRPRRRSGAAPRDRRTAALVADGRVHGIRTGDKGLGRDGARSARTSRAPTSSPG